MNHFIIMVGIVDSGLGFEFLYIKGKRTKTMHHYQQREA